MTGELFTALHGYAGLIIRHTFCSPWITAVPNPIFFIDFENVKVVFLPPNMTTKLQPNGRWHHLKPKMVYRKKFLQHIIFVMDAASTASDIAKKIAVIDAILGQKWFQKCWFPEVLLDAQTTDKDDWGDEDLLSLLPPSVTFKDYTSMSSVAVMSQPRKPSVMTGKDTCC